MFDGSYCAKSNALYRKGYVELGIVERKELFFQRNTQLLSDNFIIW